MAMAIMAIGVKMATMAIIAMAIFKPDLTMIGIPLKNVKRVRRSCRKDLLIKSYELFCKLIRKSVDFTMQKWHVGQKVSNTFSSAPIFKHQTFFLQELYQNERIQQIPVDLGILGHSVPS